MLSGLHGNGVGVEPAESKTKELLASVHTAPTGSHMKSVSQRFIPADKGRSSQTRLVSGVRLLQSPSEWTEDTEEGLSPPESPGPGDFALRPLERPLPFEDFAPPANKGDQAPI